MLTTKEFFIVMDDATPEILIMLQGTNKQQKIVGRAAKEIINQIKFWEENN